MQQNGMRCVACCDMIVKARNGNLNAKETEAMLEHIQNCPSCREEYRCMIGMQQLLQKDPVPPLPKDFAESLHERLTASEDTHKRKRVSFPSIPQAYRKVLIPAAACIALTLSVFSAGMYQRFLHSDDLWQAEEAAPPSFKVSEAEKQTEYVPAQAEESTPAQIPHERVEGGEQNAETIKEKVKAVDATDRSYVKAQPIVPPSSQKENAAETAPSVEAPANATSLSDKTEPMADEVQTRSTQSAEESVPSAQSQENEEHVPSVMSIETEDTPNAYARSVRGAESSVQTEQGQSVRDKAYWIYTADRGAFLRAAEEETGILYTTKRVETIQEAEVLCLSATELQPLLDYAQDEGCRVRDPQNAPQDQENYVWITGEEESQ